MKGWLSVPGIREHVDRTLDEQMLGLDRALAECRGKRVLDLGCAEGLIGREFARAGAALVVGIEVLQTHVDVARRACAKEVKEGKMVFVVADLRDVTATPPTERYDIVLALGIIHKLHAPAVGLEWAADSASDLLCFRAPSTALRLPDGDYIVKAKHFDAAVNVPKAMRAKGFVDEGTVDGVRGEAVQYWRRTR